MHNVGTIGDTTRVSSYGLAMECMLNAVNYAVGAVRGTPQRNEKYGGRRKTLCGVG